MSRGSRGGQLAQSDLFSVIAEPADADEAPTTLHSARPAERHSEAPPALHEEQLVRQLEATGRYRILRQLVPRAVVQNYALNPGQRVGIILDTETTGLNHLQDEIIELGMVAFTYDENGIQDVIGTFSELREPSVPVSAEITRITGITDEMVSGRTIDLHAVSAFIANADLIIAHNASFDRTFCERFHPHFQHKAWACSVAEVEWSAFGFEGSKLVYLVGQCGLFHNGHRAVDDCHALLEVLAAAPADAGETALQRLVTSSSKKRLRVFAQGSPFELKDVLKARGYRWNDGSDGQPKSWWTEIDEAAYADELIFLQTDIYRADVEPIVQIKTAFDRYRK
ncbi:3'-5' exonuclease [Aurantimonas sp. VKM B-3413]|uniref:3'-5' exonuclease n=1 Tax=Aurantimonas sp. VKM B-3413 TaxID=2779401 RepID=UPI001E2E6C0E|nr:3'-5' exonuclease [Aurantimonas sp. VKM B-3413]MCB8837024.1 3'-5' exonuclease [Aurantimonas sp. VKM B-3413]